MPRIIEQSFSKRVSDSDELNFKFSTVSIFNFSNPSVKNRNPSKNHRRDTSRKSPLPKELLPDIIAQPFPFINNGDELDYLDLSAKKLFRARQRVKKHRRLTTINQTLASQVMEGT